MTELNLIDQNWFLVMQCMYICINVAKKPTSFSEKVNSMSIAFQKSTKEVEKIANQLSALS